jgi:5-methylcytosine-specific restriction endonuclease McrA
MEDTLEAMVEVFLERKDPLRKAKRAQKNAEKKETESPSFPMGLSRIIRKQQTGRVSFRSLRNKVFARDGGRCTENNPDGSRCEQTRWLHTHHIKPLSEGGTNDLENLTVLCSGHHRMVHRKSKT